MAAFTAGFEPFFNYNFHIFPSQISKIMRSDSLNMSSTYLKARYTKKVMKTEVSYANL